MPTLGVDYDALAKQFGAVGSTPDYSALAKQFGATGSTPAADSVPGMPGGTPPGPPKPPLPEGLGTPKPEAPRRNPRTGLMMTPTPMGSVPILDAPVTGAKTAAEGVEQIADAGAKGTTPGRQIAGGTSKIIRGGMGMATPALPAAALTAPVATAVGLGTGSLAGSATEGGLKLAGVPPEYAALAGDVAGIGVGGKVATKIGRASVPEATEAISTALMPRRNPKTAITQALKPTATNTTFQASLDRSMPEIKASEAEVGPIANAPQGKALDHLMTAIDSAKKRVWGQYQQMAGPAANAQIDMSPVSEAMIQSIPQKYAMENPVAAAAIMNKAALYRRTMPLQQAEQFLKETNAELQGQYAKYPPDQRKALAANPQIAYREAQANALRDAIYGYLDQPGGGTAARELKQRYGALMNMEREAYRRQNVANRQQPDSLSEQFGKWSGYADMVRGALTGNPVDVAVGAAKRGMAKAIKEQQTTDALIRSAFRNYNQQPAPIQMPPPFQPKGLLTTGDIITPPPADTSGVRAVPAMAQPPNPARALPAPTTKVTPPPPDASFVRGVPAVSLPLTRDQQMAEYYTRQAQRNR